MPRLPGPFFILAMFHCAFIDMPRKFHFYKAHGAAYQCFSKSNFVPFAYLYYSIKGWPVAVLFLTVFHWRVDGNKITINNEVTKNNQYL